MKKTICIFEDEGVINLFPVAYTRPAYDLLCGITTLRGKIASYFRNYELILHSRKYLSGILTEQYPESEITGFGSGEILFINGRLLMSRESFAEIKKLRKNSLLMSADGSVIAALLTENNFGDLLSSGSDWLSFNLLSDVKTVKSQTELMKYPWDFVNRNGSEIANDFKRIVKRGSVFRSDSVILKNKKNIFIGNGAVVNPFVVLDATDGPIFIGNRVRIMPNCFIQGPAFIGDDSIVKAGAAIYHNTSIGEMCKVGGEIESSIILSYSNKQHAGFLGHSYLGSWINIGAGTNNSDLKNNYENISVLLNGKPVDTGSKFVGLIMGDHSKTAINTMFNTGTITGVSCNIFGAGFPPRYIPSFSWGGSDFLKTYDINKSLQVADLVFKRRGKSYTAEDGNLLKRLFEITSAERSRNTKA